MKETRVGLVDIHCHLLPAIDDGACDTAETMAMAEIAVADGIERIIATPHQLGRHAGNDAASIRAAVEHLQCLLDNRRLPLEVFPGADVRVEPDLLARLRADEVLTLADRGRHVLLELPHDLYLPMDGLLEGLGSAGISGILSHPERNCGIQRRPDLARLLIERGCLLQVTAGSLLGEFGAQARELAEWLLDQRCVHLIATDGHDTHARRPALRAAFDRLLEIGGFDFAVVLCSHNPALVVEGLPVMTVPRRRSRLFAQLWPW